MGAEVLEENLKSILCFVGPLESNPSQGISVVI